MLPADIYGEECAVLVAGSMTVFDINVQYEHITPIRRVVNRGVNGSKRIIDHCIDFALQIMRGFRRIKIERALKLIVEQLLGQFRMLGAQRRGG